MEENYSNKTSVQEKECTKATCGGGKGGKVLDGYYRVSLKKSGEVKNLGQNNGRGKDEEGGKRIRKNN